MAFRGQERKSDLSEDGWFIIQIRLPDETLLWEECDRTYRSIESGELKRYQYDTSESTRETYVEIREIWI